MGAQGGYVDAARIPQSTRSIADADHFHAVGGERERGVRSDIAESLYDGRSIFGRDADLVEGIGSEEGDAVAGGLGASGGALHADGLAGDDRRHQVTGMGGVGIGDPRHGLFVGAHVRGHDIDFGADEGQDFHGEAAGESLEFAPAHVARIAGDAALTTAVGEVHERAFPVHPQGKCGDFAEIDGGMVAQAAFDGAAGEVVLDAVAVEDLCGAVIALDGHGDADEALGPFAAFAQVGGECEKFRDEIELFRRHGENGVGKEFLLHDLSLAVFG
jgi:hypothetical protein